MLVNLKDEYQVRSQKYKNLCHYYMKRIGEIIAVSESFIKVVAT